MVGAAGLAFYRSLPASYAPGIVGYAGLFVPSGGVATLVGLLPPNAPGFGMLPGAAAVASLTCSTSRMPDSERSGAGPRSRAWGGGHAGKEAAWAPSAS
ncbi:MAG: hypothetical protein AB1425_03295 [Actinomycetota bacterium]